MASCLEESGKGDYVAFQRYVTLDAKRQQTGSVRERLTFVKEDRSAHHD